MQRLSIAEAPPLIEHHQPNLLRSSLQSSRHRHVVTYASVTSSSQPPRTCSDAVAEARGALRRFRDASRQSPPTTPTLQPLSPPYRLTLHLPLPSPSYPKGDNDLIREFDESEWPGGIQQKFRALRPLIESLVDGFGSPQFVGMLESPADGIGVWTLFNGGATLATLVTNATFSPFARLCSGDFGARVLEDRHVLLVVNPSWTASKDIGQFWDKELKRKAAQIIDDTEWTALHHFEDVRTAKGATGILYRNYPDAWRVFLTVEAEEGGKNTVFENIFTKKDKKESEERVLVMNSEQRPSPQQMIEVLNEALNKSRKEKDSGSSSSNEKKWWGGR